MHLGESNKQRILRLEKIWLKYKRATDDWATLKQTKNNRLLFGFILLLKISLWKGYMS